MCKLLASSKLLVRKQSQIVELTRLSAEWLGTTQRDGFGFALSHENGIYGEKYLRPESCKGMGIVSRDLQVLPKGLKVTVARNRDFLTFGKFPAYDRIKGSYISHGRTATCGREITNTHPFHGIDSNNGSWTIAHNGVVDHIGEKHEMATTCDSEHILHCFTKGKGVHSLKTQISGYAAVVGINPNGELFAFRDNVAPLYCSYIEDLGVCTLSTDPVHCVDYNKTVCKHNKAKQTSITSAYMIEPYVLHVFSKDGMVDTTDFEAFSRYTNSASAVSRSLGSAGVTSYIGNRDYRRYDGKYPYQGSTTYPGYSHSNYSDDYEEPDEIGNLVQQEMSGIKDTEEFLDDPALREAVKNGELRVRDIADIAGETPNDDQIRYLEKQIEMEKQNERKSK
jgi:predicted glutamine amidotransferase